MGIEPELRKPAMAAMALTERQAPKLRGVLPCDDRILVTGTRRGACFAGR